MPVVCMHTNILRVHHLQTCTVSLLQLDKNVLQAAQTRTPD